MKKLMKTEADLKKSVTCKKATVPTLINTMRFGAVLLLPFDNRFWQ